MSSDIFDYPDVPDGVLKYTDRYVPSINFPKTNPSFIFRVASKSNEMGELFILNDGLDNIYYTKAEDIEQKILKYSEAYQNDPRVDLKSIMEDVTTSDISFTQLYQIANIIYWEKTSSSNKEEAFRELKCLFHTAINRSIDKKCKIWDLLQTGYSSVEQKKKKELVPTEFPKKVLLQLTELICYIADFLFPENFNNYVPGKNEISEGASYWDGSDFLAWGLEKKLWKPEVIVSDVNESDVDNASYIKIVPHAKFREYHRIIIPNDIYDIYEKNSPRVLRYGREQEAKKDSEQQEIKNKIKDYYNTPAAVFLDKKNWRDLKKPEGNCFVFEQDKEFLEKYKLKKNGSLDTIVAKIAIQGSIFWKVITESDFQKENKLKTKR